MEERGEGMCREQVGLGPELARMERIERILARCDLTKSMIYTKNEGETDQMGENHLD